MCCFKSSLYRTCKKYSISSVSPNFVIPLDVMLSDNNACDNDSLTAGNKTTRALYSFGKNKDKITKNITEKINTNKIGIKYFLKKRKRNMLFFSIIFK